MKFTIKQSSYCNSKYASWIGKCTVGDISIRGTRLWLTPYASTYYAPLMEHFCEKKDDFFNNMNKILNDKNSEEDIVSLFGDDYTIRDDHIKKIILGINGIDKECYKLFEFENIIKLKEYLDVDGIYTDIDYDKFYDFFVNTKKNDPILIDKTRTETIWILHKKNEIIEELNNVIEKCEENNITFEWI